MPPIYAESGGSFEKHAAMHERGTAAAARTPTDREPDRPIADAE